MTFVDTSVLLDVVTDWSIAQLEAASLTGPLLINDTIYAELSIRYERIEHLDRFVSKARLGIVPIPRAAHFLAGKAFVQYRRISGAKTGILPHFFIGAHAAVGKLPLLTRDVGRYRTYFPSLALITPAPRGTLSNPL